MSSFTRTVFNAVTRVTSDGRVKFGRFKKHLQTRFKKKIQRRADIESARKKRYGRSRRNRSEKVMFVVVVVFVVLFGLALWGICFGDREISTSPEHLMNNLEIVGANRRILYATDNNSESPAAMMVSVKHKEAIHEVIGCNPQIEPDTGILLQNVLNQLLEQPANKLCEQKQAENSGIRTDYQEMLSKSGMTLERGSLGVSNRSGWLLWCIFLMLHASGYL